MPFKVTYFWNQQAGDRSAGWEENFWWSGDDGSVAIAAAKKLYDKLFLIHGNDTFCSTYSVSNVDEFRSAETIATGVDAPVASDRGNVESDYPVMSLAVESRSPLGRTRQWISGIPDFISTRGGKYTPDAKFTRDFGSFNKELTANANLWSRRFLNPNQPLKPVSAFDLETGTVTVPQHGFGDVGSVVEIRIKGFKTPKEANGVFRVTVLDPNSVAISFWNALTSQTIEGRNPTARLQVYVYEKITSITPERITSHKRGRPSKVLSGRAKNKD